MKSGKRNSAILNPYISIFKKNKNLFNKLILHRKLVFFVCEHKNSIVNCVLRLLPKRGCRNQIRGISPIASRRLATTESESFRRSVASKVKRVLLNHTDLFLVTLNRKSKKCRQEVVVGNEDDHQNIPWHLGDRMLPKSPNGYCPVMNWTTTAHQ